MSLWPKVREELNIIVNQHFETPEYHQLFSLKLTPARQKVWDAHYPHYIKSRRDCWGAAAVKAPLDVKRAIWEHEKDELIFDKRMGSERSAACIWGVAPATLFAFRDKA
jgi:hypothetical protein